MGTVCRQNKNEADPLDTRGTKLNIKKDLRSESMLSNQTIYDLSNNINMGLNIPEKGIYDARHWDKTYKDWLVQPNKYPHPGPHPDPNHPWNTNPELFNFEKFKEYNDDQNKKKYEEEHKGNI